MSENITNVRLLQVALESDYKHTFYFVDKEAQANYFLNLTPYKEFSDFSYQRKESKLRVNLGFDESLKYNYVMYKNLAYSNKWFYAFITDYEWKREDVTELTLDTDVMQTWKFDITIKPSFIEREHARSDDIGENTIPENLEVGEYQVKNVMKMGELQDYYIIVACTQPPTKFYGDNQELAEIYAMGGNYNGIYSGLAYYRFGTTTADILILNNFIKSFDDSNAIKTIFMYPKSLIESEKEFVLKSNEPKILERNINKFFAYDYDSDDPVNNYVPKNNKLKTFPYIYLLVSNNNGGSAIYQYEHFSGTSASFKIESALTPGGSIRLIPTNYKGITENHEEGLNLGKYPICNWTSDEFTNWLTQNSVNIGLSMVTGIGQVIGGVAMAVGTSGVGATVGGGMAISGVSTIVNQLTQIHQMSFTPQQSQGNINCGDVITASKENTFTFYSMTIKPEYMRIIDEFLSTYGYKTNRIKVPNSGHRAEWWFTKTVDVNIIGSIPIADLNKIKDCYNNGITFWKNPKNIKDYTLNNNII